MANNAEESVLVVVDVQGKLATLMDRADELFLNLSRMVQGAKALGVPVLVVEQIPEKLGPTISDVSDHLPNQPHISKTTFSAMKNELFVHELELLEREHVVVTGIETHICVYQTVRDLLLQDFNVSLVADAVGSRSVENKTLALDNMRQAGVEIISVETCLFDWMKDATHPAFREIQALVK